MDPNVLLEQILELAKGLAANPEEEPETSAWVSREVTEENAYQLAVAVQSLDEWLSKKGFLPKRWQR